MHLIFLLLSIGLLVQNVSATTWFVDRNATAGLNTGASWTDAWNSIENIAWKKILPGDTVTFAAGDYTTSRLMIGAAGAPGAPITLDVAQDAAHNGRVNFQGISIGGKDWVTLNGALDQSVLTSNIFHNNLWSITNNAGFRVTTPDNTGITTSSGKNVRVLWCEVYNCGSVEHPGNEHGFLSNGIDPGPLEIAYCWFHDNIYGSTISIVQNDTAPLNDLNVHHCIMWNTGDNGITSAGGLSLSWCIIRERTSGFSSGHTDAVQNWSGPYQNGGNIVVHHNEIGDLVTGDSYGSWALIQFSGASASNLFFYDNLMVDTHVPLSAQAAAGWVWTFDGFYNTYNSITVSNFLVFNNLFRSPAHQPMIVAQQTSSDWRAICNSRGFVANLAFSESYFENNTMVDCYVGRVGSPVFSIPSTNPVSHFFPAGSVKCDGILSTYGDTNVFSRAIYDSSSLRFLNNILSGPNTALQISAPKVFLTPEKANAALRYSGNTSKRPLFLKYDGVRNWNFHLRSSDIVARNAGLNLGKWIGVLPDLELDLDGNPRPQTGAWDIGPYQYSALSAGAPMAPTGIHVNSTPGDPDATEVIDPSTASSIKEGLVVHLTFDDDFSSGVMLDSSGYGNHAYRFGRPEYPTNWPTRISGKSGSGAEFHTYWDGWDSANSGRSGDYAGITNIAPLLNATQLAITAWCYYYTADSNQLTLDHNATILDAGYAKIGAWHFGRYYSSSYGNTKFFICTNNSTGRWFLPAPSVPYDNGWPENYGTTHGNSGGWHHYAVTVDCSNGNALVKGYFQGTNFVSSIAPNVPYLTIAPPTTGLNANRFSWLAVGSWTHNGSAPMEEGDHYPNNGWLNGALDNIRVYNRVLSPDEIYAIYSSGQ